MVRASNFFKLDSLESDSDEEWNKSKVRVEKSLVNKKSEKEKTVNSEAVDDDDNGGKKSKKKKDKKQSGGDEEALVNTDEDDIAKRKLDFSDLGGEENKKDKSNKKKKKKASVDSEVEGISLSSAKDGKKKRKEKKEGEDSVLEVNKHNDQIASESPEAEGNSILKKKRKKKKKQSEDTELEGNNNNDGTKDANQIPNESPEAEGNGLKSSKDSKKKKKKKQSEEDPEVEENNDGTKDANQIQSEGPEAEGNGLKSSKDSNKKKKKKKKQSEDQEVEENNKDSTENSEKKLSEDSEAEGNDLNPTENENKKRKMKKKKQSEDSEPEENNNDGAKTKKRKKKQESTPSSKSAKRVKFSDQVEVFPTEDKEMEEEDSDEEVVVQVSGKRFTKEEDELIRKSVLQYVENHDLGDEGVDMVMECKLHKELRGCWKEIAAALPWRPLAGVYNRAHTIFEQGSSKGIWSKEDFELIIEYQKKHGNDWRTLADAMGKHRKHVKDAWRRIRLASKKRGHWSREEYQNLFDLVNKDFRMKAFREKRSKHGMIRDDIPWTPISDELQSRDHTICCVKWYKQLLSPMVANGIWENVDDYRLLDELTSLDAACVDDVDWDSLLDNRDGDTCRSRWNQMVNHIGLPGTKTFAEQVEILSQRYCPDIAEDREDFDNRPFED